MIVPSLCVAGNPVACPIATCGITTPASADDLPRFLAFACYLARSFPAVFGDIIAGAILALRYERIVRYTTLTFTCMHTCEQFMQGTLSDLLFG